MADDRERNQGMKQGTGEGSGQHAPGRNPQDDRAGRWPATATSSRAIGGVVILIPVGAATAAASKKADRTNRLVAKSGAVHTEAHAWCFPEGRCHS
jgi:hypothetical protein